MSSGEQVLQDDIDTLVSTSRSWGLIMNVSKCVCIRFCSRSHAVPYEGFSPYTVGTEHINFVSSHSNLGVRVDRSLKFHEHIRHTANKCNGLTTNLLSSTLSRDSMFLMNVYTSHIRQLMEYCSCLWSVGYLGDMRLLERVQWAYSCKCTPTHDLTKHENI